ncbi:MAG: lamin tail domain-containing protein [Bacteroides sp.]|jgi:hypothetical protein|nr:lamin tail domain-containing protein [Bacteroides sp.]
MRTNRIILAIALLAFGLSSCVKDEVYIDDSVTAESPIVMNEVFSRGVPENPDWVEVYNTSNENVDLSGYKIYDGGGQSGAKPKMEFPAGTIIPPKGFFVIVVDSEDEAGFGLSSGGDIIWLENAAGEQIDNVEIPAMPIETTSYGRMPDGSDNWQILETVTRGTANDDSPAPEISDILMNEVYSRGIEGNLDWVEIYNTSDGEIDISGFKIYDSGGQSGSKPKKEIPAGSLIPAKGFMVIIVDDEEDSGFGISSGGETLWLEDASGEVIHTLEVPAVPVETNSYGAFPDGSDNWQILEFVTRGTANNDGPAPVVKLNEAFSRGIDGNPDWIEVYNASAEDVDITGYKIYDSGGFAGTKPKKLFPEGSVVPANGFLVIVVDDEDESGFGLSSGGDAVWLEDTDGNVMDFVAIPALEESQSFGRFADGAHNWQVLNFVTRGTANSDAANAPAIVMNETYSRGDDVNPDWIEIYNTSSGDIDISGYKIYDSGGFEGTKPKKEFPAGSLVPANGFLVIVVDDEDDSGFGLGSGGDAVWLEDTGGNVIDFVIIPALETTQSFGRFEDGAHNWEILNTVTNGSANSQ